MGRLTAGMTVVDMRANRPNGLPPNCDVALDVDVDRFRDLLISRLVHLDQQLGG